MENIFFLSTHLRINRGKRKKNNEYIITIKIVRLFLSYRFYATNGLMIKRAIHLGLSLSIRSCTTMITHLCVLLQPDVQDSFA